MTPIKKYFMFSDESIAYLEDDNIWFNRPVKVYTSQIIGLGEWVNY